ncbi:hypothetical protein [Bacillus sp. 1P02SD]|uniref:hypothetical protein n=1 Tax=Bacillus sp. 1P02SD TaxID=3132264 RepID=UPI0039A165DA
MTQRYFPFDSGAGGNITEVQWTKMAQHWLKTGVIKDYLNELQVYAVSSGMEIFVKSGAAWIKGHYYENDEEIVLAIGQDDAVNPRIDRVILRLDWISNTIGLAVLQGVTSVNPEPPALTQNSARWEIPLAQVRVNANISSIDFNDVVGERAFVRNVNAFQDKWLVPTLLNNWVPAYNSESTPAYLKDEMGFVHLKGTIRSGGVGEGLPIFILPVGYRPLEKLRISASTHDGANYIASRIGINPDGRVYLDAGGVGSVYFDTITFRAEQ